MTELAEIQAVEKVSHSIQQQLMTLRVIDRESRALVGSLLIRIKGWKQQVDALCDPVIRSTDQAHKGAVAQKKSLLTPVMPDYERLRTEVATWDADERRRQREAEAARAAEREHLQKEADQRAKGEAERIKRDAEEVRLRAALEAEARGDTQTAEAIIDAPAPTVHVMPQFVLVEPLPDLTRPDDIGMRELWHAEVFNLKALAGDVWRGAAAVGCIKPEMKVLNDLAKHLRSELKIAGVRAVRVPKATVPSS